MAIITSSSSSSQPPPPIPRKEKKTAFARPRTVPRREQVGAHPPAIPSALPAGLFESLEYLQRTVACLPERSLNFETLDALTQKVSSLLTQLRGRRNLRTMVGRLPNEVLGNVFKMLQHCLMTSCAETDGFSAVFETYATWTTVMDVCRRWRGVAITSPDLWTTIHIQHSQGNYRRLHPILSLQRSPKCPLEVFVDLFADSALVSPLLAHLSEVRGLHLEGDHWSLHSVTQWSILHTKVLAVIGNFNGLEEGLQYRTLPSIFRGDLSSINSLTISKFEQYPELSVPQLRRLRIFNCHYQTHNELASLVRLIADAPLLEELAFTDTSFEDWSFPGRRISLSTLRKLSFARGTSGTAHFLKCIELPNTLSLAFDIGDSASSVQDYQFFPPDLSSLHNIEDLTSFKVTVNEAGFSVDAVGESATFAWRSGWVAFDDRDMVAMTDLMDGVSSVLDQATSLCIHLQSWHSDYPHQTRWLKKILAFSTNVVSLYLVAGSEYLAHKMLAALDEEQEDEAEDRGAPCPFLQELHVDVPGEATYTDLREVLRSRHSEDPLGMLCIHTPLSPSKGARPGRRTRLQDRIEGDFEVLRNHADEVVVKNCGDRRMGAWPRLGVQWRTGCIC